MPTSFIKLPSFRLLLPLLLIVDMGWAHLSHLVCDSLLLCILLESNKSCRKSCVGMLPSFLKFYRELQTRSRDPLPCAAVKSGPVLSIECCGCWISLECCPSSTHPCSWVCFCHAGNQTVGTFNSHANGIFCINSVYK